MLVGQTVGPFLIEKELGSGAMGAVFRARYTKADDKLPPVVALKVILFGLSGNESALARFRREAEILKQLRHTNIVRLFATGKFRDTQFFAMEYIDGESLDRRLSTFSRFPWEEVVLLGKQLCDALQHAHDKGIIHRDLKPSNLMVMKDNTLKLTDFGIAKDTDVTALTGANNTIGTAAYMSPEQCKGVKELTGKSDLYSMGIVFYELLTGKKPFEADSPLDMFMAHVHNDFIRPRFLQPEIPVWLDVLVCQMLEKEPAKRPLDAAMVKRSLEELEQKEQEKRSAGVDVANARVLDKDKLLASGPLTEKDKEAVRVIRASSRKKKVKRKTIPVYRRGWFVATASVFWSFVVLGGLWSLTRPDSPEKMLARIQASTTPETRRKAIDDYMASYSSRTDEIAQRVRDLDREEKVRIREVALLKRHGRTNLRDNAEDGENKAAYQTTMNAIGYENDGDLVSAKRGWQELSEKYAKEPAIEEAMWGWHADRRLAYLDKLQQDDRGLVKLIRADQMDDRDPGSSDELSRRTLEATRTEMFGDFTLARDRWKKIRDDLVGKYEDRQTLILAARHYRDLMSSTDFKDEERVGKIGGELTAIAEGFKKADEESDPIAQRVEYRTLRNRARLVRDVYRTGTTEMGKLADRAEKLVRDHPRKE